MCRADNLTTILCSCYEIWEPKFLELSGPHQTCNGTALPLPLSVVYTTGTFTVFFTQGEHHLLFSSSVVSGFNIVVRDVLVVFIIVLSDAFRPIYWHWLFANVDVLKQMLSLVKNITKWV